MKFASLSAAAVLAALPSPACAQLLATTRERHDAIRGLRHVIAGGGGEDYARAMTTMAEEGWLATKRALIMETVPLLSMSMGGDDGVVQAYSGGGGGGKSAKERRGAKSGKERAGACAIESMEGKFRVVYHAFDPDVGLSAISTEGALTFARPAIVAEDGAESRSRRRRLSDGEFDELPRGVMELSICSGSEVLEMVAIQTGLERMGAIPFRAATVNGTLGASSLSGRYDCHAGEMTVGWSRYFDGDAFSTFEPAAKDDDLALDQYGCIVDDDDGEGIGYSGSGGGKSAKTVGKADKSEKSGKGSKSRRPSLSPVAGTYMPTSTITTNTPTLAPNDSPDTQSPTKAPTDRPTDAPTDAPTDVPTDASTDAPTDSPAPTVRPSDAPTDPPTDAPTDAPTDSPVTQSPTKAPTDRPTDAPTDAPTDVLTEAPTDAPTVSPAPTSIVTPQPSRAPTTDCPSASNPPPSSLPPLVPNQSGALPLPLQNCVGGCSVDADCAEGLSCYLVAGNGPRTIPGCFGAPQGTEDYCANVPDNYLDHLTSNPGDGELARCKGDCETDDHCMGNLLCFMRGGGFAPALTPVPGCCGEGRRATDYCYDPNDDRD